MKYVMIRAVAVALLSLCLSAGASPKEITATVDSLAGKAEIQKSGRQEWRPASVGAKLHGSDIVRALDNSFMRISWPDGNVSYVHANSQMQLNFSDSSRPDVVSTHLTVLYGAIFFVVREILPKAMTKTYDTKMYTPTAVVSVRGTAFAVDVDKKNGETGVQAIRGTLLVRNIIKDASLFLGAGFKTKVAMNTDPIVASALLDADITDLKSWVPPPVIENEMAAQLSRAQRDHEVLTGDFNDKAAIAPFANKSKYRGPWNIGLAVAQQLADQLGQSNKSVALSEADTAPPDPLKIGVKYRAQFVVTGDIEDFDIVQHAEITPSADEYKEYYIAHVRLRVQLIGMADKKMLFDDAFVGETRGKNVKENSWKKIGKLSCNLKDPRFSSTILGCAAQQALDQATEKIIRSVNASQ